MPNRRVILRSFEQARIVPDNPFAFPPSMEVKTNLRDIGKSFIQGCTYTAGEGCEGAVNSLNRAINRQGRRFARQYVAVGEVQGSTE